MELFHVTKRCVCSYVVVGSWGVTPRCLLYCALIGLVLAPSNAAKEFVAQYVIGMGIQRKTPLRHPGAQGGARRLEGYLHYLVHLHSEIRRFLWTSSQEIDSGQVPCCCLKNVCVGSSHAYLLSDSGPRHSFGTRRCSRDHHFRRNAHHHR
ncbi:hypothetical protein GGS26DRAFT_550519 [Hypomontagnella submonticulosa]|nr:hypothetical protein GGS26DRAFT_550519 [Hypomontagnella submonticulosa]